MWRGWAWYGKARQGLFYSGHGVVWRGEACRGLAWLGMAGFILFMAWQGWAGLGKARYGLAM